MNSDTITLGGILYNRETGEAIGSAKKAPTSVRPSVAHHASSMHPKTQRSATLQRKYVASPAKKPATPTHTVSHSHSIKVTQKPAQVERSAQIRRFAKHPVDIAAPQRKTARPVSDMRPATVHPMVQQVHAKRQKPTVNHSAKPSEVIKREAIDTAMQRTESTARHRAKARVAHKKSFFSRFATLASAGTAVLLIAGYFTYLNMPNLSVRVAAAQAGIDAEYPAYHPSGYSLDGPVAYNAGQVSMTFGANGSSQEFKLVQSKSGWDSSAVLEQYVEPKAGNDYTISRERGLTVYTFDNNAAWVDDGMLYTIDGDAELSIDQVRRMAISL